MGFQLESKPVDMNCAGSIGSPQTPFIFSLIVMCTCGFGTLYAFPVRPIPTICSFFIKFCICCPQFVVLF